MADALELTPKEKEIAKAKQGFAINKEAINKKGSTRRNPVQQSVERVLAESTAWVDPTLPEDEQLVHCMSRLDAIVRTASIQAENGNKDAREWLADRLEGKPRTRAHITVGAGKDNPYEGMSDRDLEKMEIRLLGDDNDGSGIIRAAWEFSDDQVGADPGPCDVSPAVRQRWPGREGPVSG